MKKLFYWYILFHRKWKPPIKGPHARGTSIECLPELIHACEGKDHIFSSMVENELQSAKTKQVYPSLLQVKSFLNLEHSFFNCGTPTHVIMESWKIGNSEGFWHNDQKLIQNQTYHVSDVFQAFIIHVSCHSLTAALILTHSKTHFALCVLLCLTRPVNVTWNTSV